MPIAVPSFQVKSFAPTGAPEPLCLPRLFPASATLHPASEAPPTPLSLSEQPGLDLDPRTIPADQTP